MPAKPRRAHSTEARLAVLETWKEDHEDRCRERYEGIGREIREMKDAAADRAKTLERVAEMVGELKTGLAIRTVKKPDGSKTVKTRVLKLDAKFIWSAIGAAGGLAVLYQVAAPTLAAMAIAFHHAIMGAR